MRELKDILRYFESASAPMGMATIVGTTGSSYRRKGARMLISSDGRAIGTLSGGCIEAEVAERAHGVIASGRPQRFSIDTLKLFGCPGSLDIVLERIETHHPALEYLFACFKKRIPAHLVVQFNEPLGTFVDHPEPFDGECFRQTILPPIRLVSVGEGSDTDAMIQFGHGLGWDLLVVSVEQIGDIIPDLRTALVVKNHHVGRDIAALSKGLGAHFGYVGLLSSLRRKRQLFSILDSEGFLQMDDEFKNFHGPAGLNIGAESPEEIALSIVAEIQATMTGHEGGFLRDLNRPIHQSTLLARDRSVKEITTP